MSKTIIYQIFTRLFGNKNTTCKNYGTLEENGSGHFNDIDSTALRRIRQLGCSHVWYTGVIRHATATDYSKHGIPVNHPAIVKGKAGSPYAIVDYYDVDPDLAVDVDNRMKEFEQLVERTHKAGLGVIIDFVPNHVARQYHSICQPEGTKQLGEDDRTDWHFSAQNNFYYCVGEEFKPMIDLQRGCDEHYREYPARATGNDHFDNAPSINDWYETIKLNYGVDYCDFGGRSEHFDPIPDTWQKMCDIVLFWAAKGVDAFRCDMAEMVPSAFWKWMTAQVRSKYPDIKFIGEVYNPALYREYIASGFDYLYDKVGMYDCLRAVTCGMAPASHITYCWQSTDDIKDHMLYFLENHDEQRLASEFFAGNGNEGIPALAVSALMRTNPMMIYAGQEYGEAGMDMEGFSGRDGRTTIFDYWCVNSIRHGYYDRRHLTKEERALEQKYLTILNIARSEKAVCDGLFYDLMYVNPWSANFNPNKQYAFLRTVEGESKGKKKQSKEIILVVANFDETACDANVNIPEHAFEYLDMPQGTFKAKDLITGAEAELTLSPTSPAIVKVEGKGVAVLKLTV